MKVTPELRVFKGVKLMSDAVLRVNDLRVTFALDQYSVTAVDGVSFEIPKGTRMGLVGESGSGKTTIAKAILKLLPRNANVESGTILLRDKDITAATEAEMQDIRWKEISLITQSAMNALNPVARIFNQMSEIFLAHTSVPKPQIIDRCMQLFENVGLNRNRIFDYPHQFSGGMRQRVIVAMAIALSPELIIADEPTTALDVIMQCQIINLLKALSTERNISILLITHDISIIAQMCQTVGVIYAGRLMEWGEAYKVFNNPYHPYTMGLKGAFPSIRDLKKKLVSIPGSPPLQIEKISGCGFADRCPFRNALCKSEIPKMVMIEDNHFTACHRTEFAKGFRDEIKGLFSYETGGAMTS